MSLSSFNRKHWDCVENATHLQIRPFETTASLPSVNVEDDMFEWSSKDERSHAKEYMDHLKKLFPLPNTLGRNLSSHYHLDRYSSPYLRLNCFPEWFYDNDSSSFLTREAFHGLPFKLSGKTDAAVCSASAVRSKIPYSGIRTVFELKKVVQDR